MSIYKKAHYFKTPLLIIRLKASHLDTRGRIMKNLNKKYIFTTLIYIIILLVK